MQFIWDLGSEGTNFSVAKMFGQKSQPPISSAAAKSSLAPILPSMVDEDEDMGSSSSPDEPSQEKEQSKERQKPDRPQVRYAR